MKTFLLRKNGIRNWYRPKVLLITQNLRDLTKEQLIEKQNNYMPLKFSHTLTEQIGGLIKAGFQITDIYEDCDGGGLFDKYMNSYVAVRAVFSS